MANMITIFRMAGSILLLFSPVFSPWFYGIYLFCGLTDIADGIAARKTNTVNEFGAKLDSAADFLFAAAAIYKLLPVLDIPKGLLIWTCLIAVIKIINIIFGICGTAYIRGGPFRSKQNHRGIAVPLSTVVTAYGD